MTKREATQQGIVQAMVKSPNAIVLAINGKGRRQNTNTKQNGTQQATRDRTWSLLGHQVLNWSVIDKYIELKTFKMEVTYMFLTKYYNI